MDVGTLQAKRGEMELQIMGYLNERQAYYTHYFDCGELGILHIYWFHQTWDYEWINIDPCPISTSEKG